VIAAAIRSARCRPCTRFGSRRRRPTSTKAEHQSSSSRPATGGGYDTYATPDRPPPRPAYSRSARDRARRTCRAPPALRAANYSTLLRQGRHRHRHARPGKLSSTGARHAGPHRRWQRASTGSGHPQQQRRALYACICQVKRIRGRAHPELISRPRARPFAPQLDRAQQRGRHPAQAHHRLSGSSDSRLAMIAGEVDALSSPGRCSRFEAEHLLRGPADQSLLQTGADKHTGSRPCSAH